MPTYTLPDGRRVRPATPEEAAARDDLVRMTFSSGRQAGALAIARRDWWIQYLSHDLALLPKGVDIPPPIVGDEEYTLRTTGKFLNRLEQSLIVQIPNGLLAGSVRKKSEHSSPSLAYDRFMVAVGQRDHWTVADEAERQKISWDPVPEWRWRWIETPDRCPRTGTSWNALTAQLAAGTPSSHLPSLEEYVLAWYAVRHEHHRILDGQTYSWLRTRLGPGALLAGADGGRVHVSRWDASFLGVAPGLDGGRASDPVEC
ncbi:hypothetical protein HY634_01995 [Candidatus Uhrbacteria bacterium]|nr:hypothetical protein [Candidatus Uhrbacteria bacterium]